MVKIDQSENQDPSEDKVEVDDSSLTSTDENYSIVSDKPSYQERPPQRSVKNIFWPTDQIGLSFEIDGSLLRTHLTAFFLVGIFMIVLICVINSEFSQAMYDMNSVINTRFGLRNFTIDNEVYFLKDVEIFDHIYLYLTQIFTEGPWLDLRVKKKDPIIYLMGVLELRQVRIQDETCEIDERIQNSTGLIKCFGEFELKYEETKDVPTKNMEINDQQISDNFELPFKYQQSSPNIPYYQGKFAIYPPGGYILTLNRAHWARKAAVNKLRFLKHNNWLNRKTRALFLDAVIYCPNTNLMSAVKLVFEISPAGGVTAILYVRTAQIFLYVSPYDFINLACIVFLTICVVYFIVEEVRELFYFKFDYFTYFSSVIDLSLIFSYIMSILYFVQVAAQVTPRVQEVVEFEHFVSFEDIILNKQLHSHCLLITLFFTILKITRYFPRFGILHLFTKSVKQSKKILVWSGFLFFFLNYIFIHTGFILFGSILEEYSSLYNTCITIIRYFMFLGDYRILWQSRPLVGKLYFGSFIILNFWLQGKFLLIIIYRTYLVFHTRLFSVRGMVLYRLLCGLCAHFCHKRKLDKLIASMCIPKEHLTFEDVNTVLKIFGFTKLERDLLFKMYTLDLKQTVNANELPILISNIIKNQVEDYQKHVTEKPLEDKQKLLMERDDEYTPKLGVEVISTELNRLETYMDALEEKVEALDCYFFSGKA